MTMDSKNCSSGAEVDSTGRQTSAINDESPIHLTLIPHAEASTKLTPIDTGVEQLTHLLTTPEVGEKDGLALIPARFAPCPEECRKHGNPKAMDCGGGQLHRVGANVVEMTMLGADLDDVPEQALQAVIDGLKERGLAFWAWETFSHEPNSGTVRARILIPLKEPLPLKHPRAWSQIAWPALLKAVGIWGRAKADNMCRDPARIYYTPRKPTEEAVREGGFVPGAALDWQSILGDALEGMAVATAEPKPYEPDPERPVDLEAIKKKLKKIQQPKSLATLLGNVLHGDAPAPPPEKRRGRQPSRYEAWRSVTSALANVAEGWEDPEALAEILKPAYASEVAEDPDDHTDWDIIVGLLETALANAPAYKAQREAEQEARVELFRREISRRGGTASGPSAASDEAQKPEGRADKAPDNWTRHLKFTTRKNGDHVLKEIAANASAILEHSPAWRGVLRFNELSRCIEMHGGPLLPPGVVRELRDDDAAVVADLLARGVDGSEDTSLKLSDSTVWARLNAVGRKNPYHPVRDYLNGLRWDGNKRAETWLIDCMGVSSDVADYARLIGPRFLISAVARGLDPGCKVDTVLVLEGSQGALKSSSILELGKPWVCDQKINIEDKDSWDLIDSHWLVELSELDALRGREVTAMKAFFSRCEDKFRRAYGLTNGRVRRGCVFIGTTNSDSYLRDETGNRRFWPVKVGRIDLVALQRDRDQLWAEAVHLYRAGDTCTECKGDRRCAAHRWWLDQQEEERYNSEQTEQRIEHDAWEDKILVRWLPARPAFVSLTTVLSQYLELRPESQTQRNQNRAARALKQLGFVRKTTVIGKNCTPSLGKDGRDRKNLYHAPAELIAKSPEDAATLIATHTGHAATHAAKKD
jgi:predicted P-loop ATPase